MFDVCVVFTLLGGGPVHLRLVIVEKQRMIGSLLGGIFLRRGGALPCSSLLPFSLLRPSAAAAYPSVTAAPTALFSSSTSAALATPSAAPYLITDAAPEPLAPGGGVRRGWYVLRNIPGHTKKLNPVARQVCLRFPLAASPALAMASAKSGHLGTSSCGAWNEGTDGRSFRKWGIPPAALAPSSLV